MKKLITITIILFLILIVAVQPKPKPQKEYTVVFYTNGGSTISTLTVPSNSKIDEPLKPTRTSSEFSGWYTTSTFDEGTRFNFNVNTVKQSITLYAKWDVDVFKVEYDFAGGELPNEEARKSYPTEFSFDSSIVYFKPSDSSTHPIHESYGRFTGWREIPQSEYIKLSSEEKEKYPFIELLRPKSDLKTLYPDLIIKLYAYYRFFPVE
ncbi:InlB B-repeat-containing protein [Haploplasma axanthum]|uniref:Listeria-Bacteroides repeat domain (List_Bact_rpt) n=1 Tax=Haploplasma axanthum TaxID=29552 RepID=A0A449BD23_HAPAX|nr:InlB B-repeat-containing protein [Haploplasma axanthum]VEU80328.1 Listeria-Bacteroides repeat domain (List_Bact_rpt) [Haploplasma axanthum]